MCSIMLIEIKKDTKVRDHDLHIMNLPNETKVQRAKIDKDI